RIARWVDFDNSYKTMDRDYMESVWWAFKQFHEKGLVYEGRKVLLYCPRCETPISNFEVAMDSSYEDVTEEAVTVRFRITNHESRITEGPARDTKYDICDTYLLAWTTTPWTLPGNVALAVGENITYVMFRIKDGDSVETYIVAKDRISSVIPALSSSIPAKAGIHSGSPGSASGRPEDVIEVLKELTGRDLVGLEYEPLYDVPALRNAVIARSSPNSSLRGAVMPAADLPQGDNLNNDEIASSARGGLAMTGDEKDARNDRVYKVYPADFVNTEEGTGIVHTAVVYGEEDYQLGMKYGLPVVPLLDEKGKFNEQAPKLIRGKYFKDSESIIKKDLEARGLLFEKKPHQHSYPHCWRCDTPLFYNAIPAWFVNIQKIKKKLLASNKKEINWYPEHLKFGRYAKSVESAPDWNISRNRYWGNPIPVWRCGKCKKDIVVGSVKELAEKAKNPSVISLSSSLPRRRESILSGSPGSALGRPEDDNDFDLHRPYIDEVILKCECGGEAKRITEIFDSWFEAGSMPFASVHYPFTPSSSPPIRQGRTGGEREGVGFPFPAQFVSEYIAQTRAWFYVMHVISLVLFGKAPFENVVTTGTILAEDGSKMSKSKRNFPDPWEVINKYGVDSLRYYLMNSVVMQADNLNFSERDLDIGNKKVIRILWNVYNYFVTYANASSSIPAHSSPLPSLSSPLPRRRESILSGSPGSASGRPEDASNILDQWILARLQELINKVTEYFDAYDTVKATREMEAFINDLSTWYLRRSRGRSDGEFFQTLGYCLVELSKVTAPVTPFISEMIYRNLVNSNANTASSSVIPSAGSGQALSGAEDLDSSSSPQNDKGKEAGLNYISVHLSSWPKTKKLTKEQTTLLNQMQVLRGIVEEAHALRAKAGIKLRQKLGRLRIPFLFPATPAKAGDHSGSPGSALGRPEDEELFDLLKSEVNVMEIVSGDKLELDTTITPELAILGLARELERQIQSLRKEAGLKIGELVDLCYETKSDMIKKAMGLVDRKKIYVNQVSSVVGPINRHTTGRALSGAEDIDSSPPAADQNDKSMQKEIEIDGQNVKLQISNVKSKSKTPSSNAQ
ncbi:isoleucine--tRNA ligase, partial [bacterium]